VSRTPGRGADIVVDSATTSGTSLSASPTRSSRGTVAPRYRTSQPFASSSALSIFEPIV
jgi:hypothetical protein